jgi:hypothetical protein
VPLPFRKEQSPNEGSQRLCLTVGGNTSGCLAALANIRSAGGGTALVKYFNIAGYCPYSLEQSGAGAREALGHTGG